MITIIKALSSLYGPLQNRWALRRLYRDPAPERKRPGRLDRQQRVTELCRVEFYDLTQKINGCPVIFEVLKL